ncbi:hypothetical protein GKC56_07525 [Neisseriaceae bacterium PsAf]|nr:hypothetical protein [Neisseriaceae bacterium PsAf]
MNSKNTFFVIYDGPLLENNEFEVRELAPAILAINDLIEESNKIIYGDSNKISLCVKANFKAGSFGIELVTHIQSMMSYLFDSNHVEYAKNLLEVIGFIGSGCYSLFLLLKKLKNRKIKTVIKDESEENTYIIHLEDGETIKTSNEVLELYRSTKVRKDTEQMLQPLEKDGIDSFATAESYKKKTDISFEISKEEVIYFKEPKQTEEILGSDISTTHATLISPALDGGYKWRFDSGDGVFVTDMCDEKFLEKVDKKEISFTQGDIFQIELETIQILNNNGKIKKEYKILKVLNIRNEALQLNLPFDDY